MTESETKLLEETSRHLRAVNHALVIATATILLALAGGQDAGLTRAIDQAEKIVNAIQTWNESWLQDYASEVYAERASFLDGQEVLIPKYLDVALTFDGPSGQQRLSTHAFRAGLPWTLWGESGVKLPVQSGSEPTESIPGQYVSPMQSPSPSTLEEFAALWDALVTDPGVVVLRLPQSPVPVRVLSGRNPVQAATGTATFEPRESEPTPPELLESALQYNAPSNALADAVGQKVRMPIHARGSGWEGIRVPDGQRITHAAFFQVSQGMYSVEVPLLSYVIPFRAQQAIRDRIDPNLVLGTFSSSFPDLALNARGIEELPLPSVREYLQTKRSELRSQVTVMGLSFSATTLYSWGIGLIAVVQWYFLLAYRGLLAQPGVRKWEYPWIGLYRDPVSATLFVVSTLVFPVAVTVSQASTLIDAPYASWIGWLIPAMASVAASAWGLYLYLRWYVGLGAQKAGR